MINEIKDREEKSAMITLGDEVIDKISKLKGIAISRIVYINACIQYGIQAEVKEDGKVPDVVYQDEAQIEVLQKEPTEIGRPTIFTGGPSMYAPKSGSNG